MQFQADILNKNIVTRDIKEITAYGAALASYIFINQLKLSEVNINLNYASSWTPNIDAQVRDKYLNNWNKAIEKAKNWI